MIALWASRVIYDDGQTRLYLDLVQTNNRIRIDIVSKLVL